MRDLCQQYLDVHAIPKKRPKSIANDRSMLDSLLVKMDQHGRTPRPECPSEPILP